MVNQAKPRVTLAEKLRRMGPAAIITSAFIGPGTIVTATVSGATFGYSLLWVVLLATIALIILMEMSSRIGIAGKKDVIEAAISLFPNSLGWKRFVQIVIFLGTLAACFAFEAGNITGASIGLADIAGIPVWIAAIITAAIALITVFLSSYNTLSRVMQFFVAIMGVIFIVAMIAVGPSLSGMAKGMFVPVIPNGGVVNALALVGTTLIGMNLVLHSITSEEKWAKTDDIKGSLSDARFDIIVNVVIGGLITMSIVTVGAVVLYGTGAEVKNALVFTKSLEPVLGKWARVVGDIGLFAAGTSSAIAVPFTMKAIFSKIFKWDKGIASKPACILGAVVVLFGAAFAIAGASPTQIIIFAQTVSGFVLPFIAAILIAAANNKKVLGEYVNKLWQNIFGIAAVILAFVLGCWGFYNAILKIFG